VRGGKAARTFRVVVAAVELNEDIRDGKGQGAAEREIGATGNKGALEKAREIRPSLDQREP
jgi:hypothetical protein